MPTTQINILSLGNVRKRDIDATIFSRNVAHPYRGAELWLGAIGICVGAHQNMQVSACPLEWLITSKVSDYRFTKLLVESAHKHTVRMKLHGDSHGGMA